MFKGRKVRFCFVLLSMLLLLVLASGCQEKWACVYCGELETGEGVQTDDGKRICESCAQDNHWICDYCDTEWYGEPNYDISGKVLCQECADDYWSL